MRLIGVTPDLDTPTGRLYLNRDYPEAVLRAGGLPVMLPLTAEESAWETMLNRVDGLLLSGGGDIDPALYGEERLPECGEAIALRDRMELALCRLALQRDLPLLGVCRGLQTLNVALGGSLYQDIGVQYGRQIVHPRHDMAREKVHGVRVEKGSRLYAVTGLTAFQVNSRHHQAVKALGRGLTASAWAEDGLIEAVEMPEKKFALAVQWHPEALSDRYPEAHALFRAFVEACEG